MIERLLHRMLAHSILKIGGYSDIKLVFPLDYINEPVVHDMSMTDFDSFLETAF